LNPVLKESGGNLKIRLKEVSPQKSVKNRCQKSKHPLKRPPKVPQRKLGQDQRTLKKSKKGWNLDKAYNPKSDYIILPESCSSWNNNSLCHS